MQELEKLLEDAKREFPEEEITGENITEILSEKARPITELISACQTEIKRSITCYQSLNLNSNLCLTRRISRWKTNEIKRCA